VADNQQVETTEYETDAEGRTHRKGPKPEDKAARKTRQAGTSEPQEDKQ